MLIVKIFKMLACPESRQGNRREIITYDWEFQCESVC